MVLDGAAQTCGKHVEILERRKNIDPSVDSFGRLKKSVMQKNKGVASDIYTQPTRAETQLICHRHVLLGIDGIDPAPISRIKSLDPFLRWQ